MVVFFFSAVLLAGCGSMVPQTMALRDTWPAGVPVQAEIAGIPFFPQQTYECGPAALATVLAGAGIVVAPEDLVAQVYIPARQGSLQIEMLAAPRKYAGVSFKLKPRFDALLQEVAAGNPVLILQDYGLGPLSRWHYAVVVGYDYPDGSLYLRSGTTARLVMPFILFEYLWRKGDYWAMVVTPPDRLPATATEQAYLTALLALDRVGDARTVMTAYLTFLKRWPDNLYAGIALANRYYATGALALAERTLREAGRHHPESVIALNNLAQTLSDQGRNAEALAVIEQALVHDGPFAAAARETRELVRQRMGQRP